MKMFGTDVSRHTEINITSLIDVIFMLVVFFMIGSTFEKPALAVSLPTASSGEAVRQAMFTVSLAGAGALYLEGEPVEEAGLERRLRGESLANPELRLALDCDGRLAFQRVTEIMDILNRAGVRNVAIHHELPR